MNRYGQIMVVTVTLCCVSSLWGQNIKKRQTENGTSGIKANNTIEGDSTGISDELDLGDISIQGKVEKPGVIIIPTRLESNIKEKVPERSFKKELRNGDSELLKPSNALRRVDQVRSIKEAVKRKRK
ncbi:hypothetical protein KAR48_10060 [bacterium]|nr:hypothetical protein [bacterium]